LNSNSEFREEDGARCGVSLKLKSRTVRVKRESGERFESLRDRGHDFLLEYVCSPNWDSEPKANRNQAAVQDSLRRTRQLGIYLNKNRREETGIRILASTPSREGRLARVWDRKRVYSGHWTTWRHIIHWHPHTLSTASPP
jgi:hypothetical protein